LCVLFFFSSRRRHTRSLRDWSSDVCSSDLLGLPSSFSGDVPSGDVPARALVPSHTAVTGTWYAHTTAGDAILVAWEAPGADSFRSEERRVGKEWRARRSADQSVTNT